MMKPIELMIPKQRIGVLIGKNGEVKKRIQEATQTVIHVDSQTGRITILPEGEEGIIDLLTARNIVMAIGRGFNPNKAMKLLNEQYVLEIINLEEYVGRSRNALVRVKGRIIGKNGKTREIIEQYTSTDVSVFGKTVSIIGDYQNVIIAKKAIQLLINGANHGTVYAFLERMARERRRFSADFGIGEKI